MRHSIHANILNDVVVNRFDCANVAGMVELRDGGLERPRFYASSASAAMSAQPGCSKRCTAALSAAVRPCRRLRSCTQRTHQRRWLHQALALLVAISPNG